MNPFSDSRMPFTESAPESKSPETSGAAKPAEINGPAYAPVICEAVDTTPGCKRQQIGIAAGHQRYVCHFFAGDDFAHLRALGIHVQGRRCDTSTFSVVCAHLQMSRQSTSAEFTSSTSPVCE